MAAIHAPKLLKILIMYTFKQTWIDVSLVLFLDISLLNFYNFVIYMIILTFINNYCKIMHVVTAL